MPANTTASADQDANACAALSVAAIWTLLEQVKDPQIPVISIRDLGVLRAVRWRGNTLQIAITPTYSGCPAIDAIKDDIARVLRAHGVNQFAVVTRLVPTWHTGLISEAGRAQLRAYGIAPPVVACGSCARGGDKHLSDLKIACPQCASTNTLCISEFGATACKALFRCGDCQEPFDYFKAL